MRALAPIPGTRRAMRLSRLFLVVACAMLGSCGGQESGGPPAATAPVTPTPSPSPSRPPVVRAASIDEFLASCPSAADVRSVNAELLLVFDADPTRGEPPACTAAAGSADLTLFEKRVYQALLALRQIEFDAPLPWTSQSLSVWLPSAIRSIRFADVANSFCCEPGDRIVVKTATNRADDNSCLMGGDATRWIARDFPCGMDAFLALLVHEARHNQGKPHTCGSKDQTIAELGGWSAQYHVLRWFSEHSGTFLTPVDGRPSGNYYRDLAHSQARQLCAGVFCSEGCPAGFAATSPPQTPNGRIPTELLPMILARPAKADARLSP